jgi:hypothetical protein
MKIRAALLSLVFVFASRHAVSPELLVKRAHLIVRATLLAYYRPPVQPRAGRGELLAPTEYVPVGTLRFRVDEVLKGKWSDPTIDVDGRIVDADDYNVDKVPYTTSRKRPGEYVQGREYVLILHDTGTEWTTAWPSSLAPTNEQIHGSDDPWARWIRDRIKQESR